MRRSAMFKAGLLALVLALSAVSAATAQVTGLYYQEVEKDGRIYVFNTPERYQSFQQTGDMGIAITLIGRGPNGETLVAENETAADLYFFKHNLPGYDRPTPKPAPAGLHRGLEGRQDHHHLEAGRARHLQPPAGPHDRRGPRDRAGWRSEPHLLPHPPHEDQVRRLGLHQGPHLRAAARHWADSANLLQDANVNYDFTKGKKILHAQGRPVQGALRPPATDLLGQPAVRRPFPRLRHLRPRPRHRSSSSGARRTTARSTGASASSTATAAP